MFLGGAVGRLRLLDSTRPGRGGLGMGRGRGEEAGVLAQEVLPAAGGLDHVAATVQGDGRGGQAVDEIAVVRHQDQGAVVGFEQFLQLLQRVHVEVVGRLVEDQEIGGLGQRPRQQQAVALAARQGGDGLLQLGFLEQEVLGVGGDVHGPAAHQDGVAAARRQSVPQGHVRLQPLARLVEVEGLEVGAHADRAFVRRQFAQQHLDQGGLARAVGADDGQPVAADDAGGQVLEDGPVAERLADALDVGDQLARDGAGIDAQVQLARQVLDPFGAVQTHLLQGAGATLVAGALGGDGAVEGVGLGLDALGQTAQGFGLFVHDLGGPVVELDEALVQCADLAAFQPMHGVGDAVQEGAVVADHQQGEPGLDQLVFQQFDGQDVEVVGRLVQQQQVGFFGEGLGEGGAADLPARQALRRLVRVEAEGLQPAFGGPALGLARGGVIGERLAGDDRLLRDIGEAGAGLERAVARVRLDQSHDHLHQGGLARPVAADQGGAAARLHRHVDAVKQRAGTVLKADVFESDEGGSGGHGGAYSD